MAKKVVGYIKLQVPAGKANPSPPIGPALGQRGLNIMEFCKAFNAQTQGMEPGLVLPVVITAFADKSFTFVLKTPPASVLIKKALKLEKGSAKPHLDKVGKLSRGQVEEIAKEQDCTPAQLALAWVLAQGDDIVPIPGTRHPERVEENVGALNIVLSENDLRRIDLAAPKGAAAGERYAEGGMQTINL